MNKPTAPALAAALATTLALLLPGAAGAAPGTHGYGYQLMTPEERAAHRERMRAFATPEEREAYRREHHERMRERAEARGLRIPDAPLPRGKGMGHGPQDGRGRGWQR